ncbi:hypothetical protein BU16DRAFT_524276 [Lophium mytilinum]|uniref:LYR motif-containing protein 2 n=1 Tax=Lophium mytilinum TaxID=390894 RepID=A0A6A6R4Z1_9PEZI|nr:hypothetical protein BU16DRAFT_524276 [Lophium mytilinum]
MIRTYASAAIKRPSRLKGPAVDLDHFIQRQRALALWRGIVRATTAIPDETTKKELRQFARVEFERHKNVTDIGHIRYLISAGKTQFDSMRSSLINSGILS